MSDPGLMWESPIVQKSVSNGRSGRRRMRRRQGRRVKVEASIVAFSSRRFDLSGPCIDYRLALVMLVNGSVQQCSNGEVFTLS